MRTRRNVLREADNENPSLGTNGRNAVMFNRPVSASNITTNWSTFNDPQCGLLGVPILRYSLPKYRQAFVAISLKLWRLPASYRSAPTRLPSCKRRG